MASDSIFFPQLFRQIPCIFGHLCVLSKPLATQYSHPRCDGFLYKVGKKSRILIFIHTATGVFSSPPASHKTTPARMGHSPLFRTRAFHASQGIMRKFLSEVPIGRLPVINVRGRDRSDNLKIFSAEPCSGRCSTFERLIQRFV